MRFLKTMGLLAVVILLPIINSNNLIGDVQVRRSIAFVFFFYVVVAHQRQYLMKAQHFVKLKGFELTDYFFFYPALAVGFWLWTEGAPDDSALPLPSVTVTVISIVVAVVVQIGATI